MMNRTLFAVCIAGFLTGCASPGYREGDSASAAMKAAAIESGSARDQIDAAWKHLDALLAADKGDLRPAFDRFAASVDSLKVSVDGLHTRTERMSAAAGSYLARWERELRSVKDDELRQKSTERRAAIENRVKQAKDLAAKVRAKADTAMAEFGDIRRILGTDLTLAGVATIKHAAARAKTTSQALRDLAVQLSSELDALSGDIASPVEQPASEPTK